MGVCREVADEDVLGVLVGLVCVFDASVLDRPLRQRLVELLVAVEGRVGTRSASAAVAYWVARKFSMDG